MIIRASVGTSPPNGSVVFSRGVKLDLSTASDRSVYFYLISLDSQ
jgi:hypothetical protein